MTEVLPAHLVQRAMQTPECRDRVHQTATAAMSLPVQTVTANGAGREWRTGLPYAGTGDGHVNPDVDRRDYLAALALARSLPALALSGRADHRAKAIGLIDAWMIDPRTSWTGRLAGVENRIEVYLTQPAILIAAGLLWPHLSTGQQYGVRRFASTLGNGALKAGEGNEPTNRQTWQQVCIAVCGRIIGGETGDRFISTAYARARANLDAGQIRPDGLQPGELARTKSLRYHLIALEALAMLSTIAIPVGETFYGKRIRSAFAAVAPYAIDPDRWPHQQIAPVDPTSDCLSAFTWITPRERFPVPRADSPYFGPVPL